MRYAEKKLQVLNKIHSHCLVSLNLRLNYPKKPVGLPNGLLFT